MKKGTLFSGAALLALGVVANAAPVIIVDTTIGTATRDGTVNAGEYVGSGAGINSGFSDVLGSGSTLYVDSNLTGQLNIGIAKGAAAWNDTGVIYIDSVAGGLTNTTTIEDTGDGGRRAISGDGGGQQSEINFAPGFGVDYAISIEDGFAGLFKVNNDGSLTFIASTLLTPAGNVNAPYREMQLTLAQIGMAPAASQSFKYIATYLNNNNAFRSNELHGVAQSTVPGGNIGQNTLTLAAGDFNTFITMPEPGGMTLLGLASLALLRRRQAR